jgi:hypothetical protein
MSKQLKALKSLYDWESEYVKQRKLTAKLAKYAYCQQHCTNRRVSFGTNKCECGLEQILFDLGLNEDED